MYLEHGKPPNNAIAPQDFVSISFGDLVYLELRSVGLTVLHAKGFNLLWRSSVFGTDPVGKPVVVGVEFQSPLEI